MATPQKTTNELTEQHLNYLEEKVKLLNERLDSLEKDRGQAFKWGIIVLGTAVIGMANWIFNQVIGGHFK